nr:DUF6544 family protein [Brevibacterium antiquum]
MADPIGTLTVSVAWTGNSSGCSPSRPLLAKMCLVALLVVAEQRPSGFRQHCCLDSEVTWSATDESRISVQHVLGDAPVDVSYNLHPDGRIQSLVFDRWGDPRNSGTFGWHPFGGEITGYRTFGGLNIPSSGRLGWNFGIDRWPDQEFFRYEITELRTI